MDAIVVGAGLNGLVAATVLARAGRRVVVLERRSEPGGLADVLVDTRRVLGPVAAELGLQRRPAPKLELADGTVVDDAPEVVAWRESLQRWRPLVRHLVEGPAPRLGVAHSPWEAIRSAVAFRRLGEADLTELLRIGPQPVADWLEEHVSDARLRAAVALDGLYGAWMGPRSPGSAATLLLHELTVGDEVVGGHEALISVAVRAAEGTGVELRTGAEVARIRVRDGAVQGVTLADGAEVDAPIVLSAADPRRTVLDLLAPTDAPAQLVDDLTAHRCRAIHSVVRVELEGTRRMRAVRDLDQVERAFDAAKYGRLPDDPPVDAWVAGGRGVATVFGTPGALSGGWTDEARGAVADAVGRAIPGARIVEVLAPPDLERIFGTTGGHLLHGEHALDQLWVGRPSLALSGHRTPLKGLFLGSAGTHPGGGLTGGPGWLAARAALEAR